MLVPRQPVEKRKQSIAPPPAQTSRPFARPATRRSSSPSPLRTQWEERRLARQGRLPFSALLRQGVQLSILYFLLFLLFLISMYSASATLQDYVSRECYALTGKWLEEYIDRRLEEVGLR